MSFKQLRKANVKRCEAKAWGAQLGDRVAIAMTVAPSSSMVEQENPQQP